ncbi:hypothetical protein JCM6882_002803 [Rhodosporidiobolus microsporus]
MATYEGSCLCGATRVEVRGPERKSQDRCHCVDCQLATGSPFGTSITVSKSDVTISGDQVGRFTSKTAVGNDSTRTFCKGCGCALAQESVMWDGRIAIQTGILGKYFSKIPFAGGEEVWVKDRWEVIPAADGANQRETM